MRPLKLLAHLLLPILLQSTASPGLAASYTLSLNDFTVSTVSLTLVNLTDSPASAPALPADATFTLPAEPLSLPPGASNTYLAASEGKFLRYTFDLPAGFYDLAFSFEALVNDEFAVYINDTVVAIQASTGVDNFTAPIPGFSLDASGAATDTSGKLEYLRLSGMQSLFLAGKNELTVFGTDTWQYGGFSWIDGTISAVPEVKSHTMFLAGLGLLAHAVRRRRSTERESKGPDSNNSAVMK